MSASVTEAWLDVGTIADIPRQGARTVAGIAIFRTLDDQVFALEDSCPHKRGKLSQGIVHGHSVTCPLHNWVIGLKDGAAKAPDEGCAKPVPLRMEGGRILFAVPA